jgi:hypothetical protein
MKQLSPLLSPFKDKTIKNIDFQIQKETISVSFNENKIIEFLGVKSFLYIEDDLVSKSRNILSSIEFYQDGFIEFIGSDDDDDYEEIYGLPNFSLDLLDQSLLIEAEAITIDGKKIKLTTLDN